MWNLIRKINLTEVFRFWFGVPKKKSNERRSGMGKVGTWLKKYLRAIIGTVGRERTATAIGWLMIAGIVWALVSVMRWLGWVEEMSIRRWLIVGLGAVMLCGVWGYFLQSRDIRRRD